jgi:hypothetical protein
VTCIGCTLACGIVLDMEQCRAVGAVFGFLWFTSKLWECDWSKCVPGWEQGGLRGLLARLPWLPCTFGWLARQWHLPAWV